MSGESILMDHPFISGFIVQKWDEWKGYKSGAEQSWQEVESYLYATDSRTTTNNKNGHNHTTHIPVVMEIKQDLEAIIMGTVMPHDKWFKFRPANRKEATKDKRLAVESYLKNIHTLNNISSVVRHLSSDLSIYGNCFAEVKFVSGTNEDKIGYTGPIVERISPYDIVMDPTASTFCQSPKIVREIITIGELKRRGDDPGSVWNRSVVEELLSRRGSRSSTFTNEKNRQFSPLGYTNWESYLSSGMVEIFHFYGSIYNDDTGELLEDRHITVADKDSVLFNGDIATPTGKPYIFQGTWEKRPDNLWGMGPLDNIIGLNYQINHRENGKSDALDRILLPDMVQIGDVDEEYDDETGRTKYLVPEGGTVQDIRPDTTFLSYDLQIDRLQAQARRSARLPGDLTGFRSAGEKTAFEVGSLTEGAMRGHLHKVQGFEMSVLEPILKAEVELARDNLSSVTEITNETEGGLLEFIQVTPQDLEVVGTIQPIGARRFSRRNQIISTLSQLSSTGVWQTALPHISSKGVSSLLEELTELEGAMVFVENAQIMERMEQEQLMAQAEQVLVDDIQQPNINEQITQDELQIAQGNQDV